MRDYKQIWQHYSSAWQAQSDAQRNAIFAQTLANDCIYTDPLTIAKGWDELSEYMSDFQKQIPNGHFEVNYFMAHNDKSIAKWDMLSGEGIKLGEGISYGQYNADGKLIAMTGFYERP